MASGTGFYFLALFAYEVCFIMPNMNGACRYFLCFDCLLSHVKCRYFPCVHRRYRSSKMLKHAGKCDCAADAARKAHRKKTDRAKEIPSTTKGYCLPAVCAAAAAETFGRVAFQLLYRFNTQRQSLESYACGVLHTHTHRI